MVAPSNSAAQPSPTQFCTDLRLIVSPWIVRTSARTCKSSCAELKASVSSVESERNALAMLCDDI